MARLSLAAIARAVRGEVILGSRTPERGAEHEVDGYSIDSRTAKPGELFFAIVGPRLDGHEFVKAAVAGGWLRRWSPRAAPRSIRTLRRSSG